jgi:glycosylphosphatidylinositol transamidase
MLGRSGAIQAAINLELDDEHISSMEILVESLNGQLPNLDMVNMVVRLCQSEGIPVALKKLVRLFLKCLDNKVPVVLCNIWVLRRKYF